MFAKHKAKVAEKKYEADLAVWNNRLDNITTCLKTAMTFDGQDSTEIMLKKDEKLFYSVSGAVLVGAKQTPGHYQGGSQGVSIPIGHIGHSTVRYRVGVSKGTFTPGLTIEAPMDKGTVYITNQRIIFQGSKQTRECRYDKLIGVHHDTVKGETTISVTNRQKPTSILYGHDLVLPFIFRLELAMAHYKSIVPQLIKQYQENLAKLQSQKPAAPAI